MRFGMFMAPMHNSVQNPTLALHHEFANSEATLRSHRLLARLVMPEFKGQADSLRAAKYRAERESRA